MAENATNELLLEHMKRFQASLDRIENTVSESRHRIGSLEEVTASISRRVDQLDDRLSRIERRLDLADA